MSKAKFEQAKALIQQKRYDEARTVLRGIDHPTAREWLMKLDKIAPAAKLKPARTMPLKRRMYLGLVGLVVVLFACMLLLASTQGRRPVPVASVPTARATLITEKTAVPTRLAEQVGITLTISSTPSATITETATAAASATPSATITETATATPNLDALQSTSDAVSVVLRRELEQQRDLQGVRSVSALNLADGYSIYIEADVAPADDNEFTMQRVLEMVSDQVRVISQVRITTWMNGVPQRNWLWETGRWTAKDLVVQPTRAPIVQPTSAPVVVPTAAPARVWDCSGNYYDCDSFSSRAEMMSYWLACPGDPSNLDGNDDGEFCESR